MTTLKLIQDDMAKDPRDFDNIATMRCAHRRYQLGDEESRGDMREDMIDLLCEHCDIDLEDELDQMYEDIEDHDAYEEAVTERVADIFEVHFIYNPLYLYDHSGITISLGSFHCPWDSGCVGFIYVTRKRAEEELQLTDTDFPMERGGTRYDSLDMYVNDVVFAGEVGGYDDYLRGDVWAFMIEDDDGEVIGSCGGFYGGDWKNNGLTDHIEDPEAIDEIIVYDWT